METKKIDRKSTFLSIYANLPVGARSEIVVVTDEGPMTWNAVWLEVEQETELSKEILEKLEKLGILYDRSIAT